VDDNTFPDGGAAIITRTGGDPRGTHTRPTHKIPEDEMYILEGRGNNPKHKKSVRGGKVGGSKSREEAVERLFFRTALARKRNSGSGTK